MSRRRFLGGAMAAGLVGALPALLREALAVEANRVSGTIADVQHVVILMQENRSFDHYFGTMAGVRGFGDRFTIPLSNGRTVWQQYNGRRIVMPYRLDQAAGNAQCTLELPHSWPDAQAAWDDGRMGSWPRAKTDASMAYYTRDELPFQFALADAFTLCDAYHCSMHGGTNPNRVFMQTGTNDPFGKGGGPILDNRREGMGPVEDGYRWTTYTERLEQAGVSWKLYQDMQDNYDNSMLATFRQYREAYLTPGSPLASKALRSTLSDGTLDGLRADVLAGTLPQVSWIIGPRAYSEHPSPSTPVQGGAYTHMVLEALLADPAVWSKTVFLQMYDENDAFFDHMPPPAAPSVYGNGNYAGKSTVDFAAELHDRQVFGLGPRVPMLVVSPWSKGGWVNSQVFDHTSILRFLERRFGVLEPNISPWRRAVCGDLSSCFDFAAAEPSPPRFPARGREWADAERARQAALDAIEVPAAGRQGLPRQAGGTRPSRALPYHLEASAQRASSGQDLVVGFANGGTAAAVFHVYDRLHLERVPRRYTVEGGKTLADSWRPAPEDQGRYDLWILGPNGFHRQCSGTLGALPLTVHAEASAGDLVLVLRNDGALPLDAVLTTLAYGSSAPVMRNVAGGESARIVLPLAAQQYWYDYGVQAGSSLWRFAGRLETGADGVSDPAMATL